MSRFSWTPDRITTHSIPRAHLRTYLEQRQLRALLTECGIEGPAADVGCGFGRMTPVLQEFAAYVCGFEREPELVEMARRLLPDVPVMLTKDLGALPYPASGEFGFAMTFTVLQHLSDDDAARVTGELKRITAANGHILVVEETDPDHHYVDKKDAAHFTHGRSVEQYESLLAPYQLVRAEPRQVEPGFRYQGTPRPTVGHYILLRGKAPV